jgi:predicted DNA-binding mobile mystery protein A
MEKKFHDLQLKQLDMQLSLLRTMQLIKRPRSGWVKTIRESLGMSATAFARRLGMTHAGVRKLENAEASDSITLASLRKLAVAIDCELHYVLLPRTSLKQQLENQAQRVAKERLRPMVHTMMLENQAVQESSTQLQLEQIVKDLLEGSRRELW